ncbi:AraC-type DNA-binding protein [Chitinophaga sp. YR627]|uniref:AraC family transcriptional regulator n=1 Tax=Chitinophaga sp. YR627 TaxID=1881041 RepID=UPI0008F39B30|nr:helix-turn-helix transcriptional regulator [Chitinophaga sp. YR627]SFO88204.1 AraC-type DNA-binding protein [Chitinophaga sp. YR627]
MKKPAIIIHTEELNNKGVDISPIGELQDYAQIAHRDDHYMFILQQQGRFIWELDFSETPLKGPTLCFVTPGQVHKYISYANCKGWMVFVNAERIPNQYREIFETYVNTRQSVAVKKDDAAFRVAAILEEILAQPALPLRATLIDSVVDTLAGLIASGIVQSQQSPALVGGQKYNTVIRYKQLIIAQCRTLKQVKAYASLLNITPLYLNEVVKEITGFPASYWINQEILLEAKRLLYYTPLDVKEIAFDLGYEDHAYFSRFFRKNTGMTPTEFRG